MAIVSSTLLIDAPQHDGRFWVQETHTDQLGFIYVTRYLASIGIDTAAVMAARALQITADLTALEIATNVGAVSSIGSLAVYTFNYSTVAQNAAALRGAYAVATAYVAIMIGDAIAALTNGQIQTAFAMTAGQVTTLRTNKLTPAAAQAAAIRAATGA